MEEGVVCEEREMKIKVYTCLNIVLLCFTHAFIFGVVSSSFVSFGWMRLPLCGSRILFSSSSSSLSLALLLSLTPTFSVCVRVCVELHVHAHTHPPHISSSVLPLEPSIALARKKTLSQFNPSPLLPSLPPSIPTLKLISSTARRQTRRLSHLGHLTLHVLEEGLHLLGVLLQLLL
jgi:hypothetical protein